MRALRLVSPHRAEVHDVPVPQIGPDDVLVRVAGAGVCHTDVSLLRGPQRPGGPFTLGHETAGTVAAMGDRVRGLDEGDAVLVCLVWSCGTCRSCRDGRDNTCVGHTSPIGLPPAPGLGIDGGMAELIRVPARHLERLGDLDPVTAGPLADAGLTPMHAINGARHRLTDDAVALVIGVGGLGHVAIQLLRATTTATVLAVDVDPTKLELAAASGAHETVLVDDSTVPTLRDLTNGYGADVVLDLVGSQASLDLAADVTAPDGALRIVGAGDGAVSYPSTPRRRDLAWGVEVRRTYTGTRADQRQVIALAQEGRLTLETTRYSLEEGPTALADLADGRVTGRAVLVP